MNTTIASCRLDYPAISKGTIIISYHLFIQGPAHITVGELA